MGNITFIAEMKLGEHSLVGEPDKSGAESRIRNTYASSQKSSPVG